MKTFDNNYSVEVLPQLIQIIRKVIYHVNELNPELDYGAAGNEEISYQEYDFVIDTVHNDISIMHSYSYYGRGSEHSIMFDSDDDKARFQVIAKIPYPSLGSQKNKLRQKNCCLVHSIRHSSVLL